ncbi:hypothetical protein L914_12740, partial [Phytophthora nicotianae]
LLYPSPIMMSFNNKTPPTTTTSKVLYTLTFTKKSKVDSCARHARKPERVCMASPP